MITDLIVSIALLYLFYKGWSKGFFRTLLGPISLVLGCVVAFVYYQKTQNITISLLICIIGPFLFTIIVSLGLKFWHKATKDTPPVLPPLSRILGGMISIVWGGSYLAIMLMLIGLIPVKTDKLKQVQSDITSSKSYHLISRLTNNKLPGASYDLDKIQSLMDDPKKIEQLQSTKEFKDLIEDERLVELFSNEKTAEQIRNKNYTQLLSNPDFQAIFGDRELLKKLFALNKKIMEEGLDDTADKPAKSRPRIMRIK